MLRAMEGPTPPVAFTVSQGLSLARDHSHSWEQSSSPYPLLETLKFVDSLLIAALLLDVGTIILLVVQFQELQIIVHARLRGSYTVHSLLSNLSRGA